MKANYYLDTIQWNDRGLVPAIVQAHDSGQVLMLAWMSRESLERTVEEGCAVYWSRSRKALWRKGEQSGHRQLVRNIQVDCDGDTLLLSVDQLGGIACHTGREHCFYRHLDGENWNAVDPVLKDPAEIYSSATTGDARRDHSARGDSSAGDGNG